MVWVMKGTGEQKQHYARSENGGDAGQRGQMQTEESQTTGTRSEFSK
jgi:hypothetical protein